MERPWLIYIVLPTLIAAPSAIASELEISAEEAKYKALYLLAIDPPEYYGERYIERISTPRVYSNWDGSRKYYVFYTYIGPGEMPTWADIEKYGRDHWARAFEKGAKPELEVSRINNFIIPALKREPIVNPNRGGPPRVILDRGSADRAIKKEYPETPYEYNRTLIEMHEPFFEYRFKGPLKVQYKYVYRGHVYTLEELGWHLTDTERYKKWEQDIKLERVFKSYWLEP